MDRFDRQRPLFGAEGQERIGACRVGVVGLGGLGSFTTLELTYLGVGSLVLVDHDRLERSNRNRLVGAWHSHTDGELKSEVARQLVSAIDPDIRVTAIPVGFEDPSAREALQLCDYVIGCVDDDASRLRLNELCGEVRRPLIDAASDVVKNGDQLAYGGRVCCCFLGAGCLVCLQELDLEAIRAAVASPEQRADEEAIYGVNRRLLGRGGPSVITVNGVVASLAATEFMASVTGLRRTFSKVEYRGDQGVVFKSTDRGAPDCYYCGGGNFALTPL